MRNRLDEPGSSLRRNEDSSACEGPAACASCWEAGRCRRRAAWCLVPARPECGPLRQGCVAREIRKEAAASRAEYLFFLGAWFRVARGIVDGVAVAAFPGRRNPECFRPIDL